MCDTFEERMKGSSPAASTTTDGRAFVEDVYRVMQDYCIDMLDVVEKTVQKDARPQDIATVKKCVDALAERLQKSLDNPFEAFEGAVLPLFQEPDTKPEASGKRKSRVAVSDVVVDEDFVEDTFDTGKQLAAFHQLQDTINLKVHERAVLEQQLQERLNQVRVLEAQLHALESLSLASQGNSTHAMDAPTFIERVDSIQQQAAALRAVLSSARTQQLH